MGEVLRKVTFCTRRPVVLSSQVKSYGCHVPIPMNKSDAFKLLAVNARVYVFYKGAFTKLTWGNLNIVFDDEYKDIIINPVIESDGSITIPDVTVSLNEYGTLEFTSIRVVLEDDGTLYFYKVDNSSS